VAAYATTTLEGHLAQPGMSGLVARVGGDLAGVVYGWPAPARAPRDPFHGIGRVLLDRYVESHPAAWLCTHPDAPARALYESAGWRQRGAFTSPQGDPRVVYTWASGGRPGSGVG